MSFIGAGIAIGNIAGALSASLGSALGIGALGSTAVGAGGLGALTAGSALAGTAGTGLGALASAAGVGGGSGAAAVAPSGFSLANIGAGGGAAAGHGVAPGSVISAMGGAQGAAGTAVPASFGSGITSTAIGAPGGAVALPVAQSSLSSLGGMAAKELGISALSQGIEGIGQSIANAQTEEESDKVHQQYFGGFAVGGPVKLAAKEGGSISLRGGDYVVPADVVSALGNGSSKAGAKYLTHLCNSLDAGPAPEAGALARARAYV